MTSLNPISITGIFFENDNQFSSNFLPDENFQQNFFDALNAGYNRIYLSGWNQASGTGQIADILNNWSGFSNSVRNNIKNKAAEKNAKICMYVTGDDINNKIVGYTAGSGTAYADAAAEEAENLDLDCVMFDLRTPNLLYPYETNIWSSASPYATNTNNFLTELLTASDAAFPNLASFRIESQYLGQWATASATDTNFPTAFGNFLLENNNYQKFDNLLIDYYYQRSPSLQSDELTFFQNSSSLTSDNSLVEQSAMSDFTNSAVQEIIDHFDNNSVQFTIGKPSELYSQVSANDLACWRENSLESNENGNQIVGFTTWPYDLTKMESWADDVQSCVETPITAAPIDPDDPNPVTLSSLGDPFNLLTLCLLGLISMLLK